MKKFLTIAAASAAMVFAAASCAKIQSSATNEASKRYYDAWVSINYPEAERFGDVVIISDEPGEGVPVADSSFIIVKYTQRDLDGTVSSSTDENLHKQLGSYVKSYYYGAQPWQLGYEGLAVGLERGIKGKSAIDTAKVESMRVGGKRSIIVPMWLSGTTRYKNESDYLKKESSSSSAIYDIEIIDATSNIIQWQLDSMARYSKLHLGDIDTTSYGYYYKQLSEPDDTLELPTDTTIYINYIGRLLNGQVFDTTIADTAKFHNIYSTTKTYGPTSVSWSSEYSEVKLGSSSVVSGFGMAIAQMKKHEKGLAMFYSSLGYSYSGSGSQIPPYAPLIFEIELVDAPEE